VVSAITTLRKRLIIDEHTVSGTLVTAATDLREPGCYAPLSLVRMWRE
jgi:hypothetical protein